MALCAGLERSKFPHSKSMPELQSHRTTPCFYILGSHSWFYSFSCCCCVQGVRRDHSLKGQMVPALVGLGQTGDKLVGLGAREWKELTPIIRFVFPQALPLSEARHNFRPCLKKLQVIYLNNLMRERKKN